jgi:hypothetical protein
MTDREKTAPFTKTVKGVAPPNLRVIRPQSPGEEFEETGCPILPVFARVGVLTLILSLIFCAPSQRHQREHHHTFAKSNAQITVRKPLSKKLSRLPCALISSCLPYKAT